MKQVTKRLHPDQDLRKGIEEMVKENDMKAGVLLSVVGSLKKAVLRMAGSASGDDMVKTWTGPFEIVSGTATLSVNGSHIHISISDKDGNVFAGHLKEGCIVRTTAEIVIGVFDDVEYKRKLDGDTGFNELEV